MIGQKLTEAWGWCFVDKAAPEAYKREKALHMLQRHGTSGTWEADDVDNWVQCHGSSEGYVATRYPQTILVSCEIPWDEQGALLGVLGFAQRHTIGRMVSAALAEARDATSAATTTPRA